MASTSSTFTPQWEYDVFLSFRGQETRNDFVDRIHLVLEEKGIRTFIDEELGGGEAISPTLLRKIEQSKISIVVFSTNYADSPWCLEELAKIHECYRTKSQEVIPIFYQINPIHVQNLSGSIGAAIGKHLNDCYELPEGNRESKLKEVCSWRDALKEIANLRGWPWDSNVTKTGTELIAEIVADVEEKLDMPSSSSPSTNSNCCFGMESRISVVERKLLIGSTRARTVGIWGMSGMGKTMLAEKVFAKISSQFQGKCYVPNVREELGSCRSLVRLRNNILSEVLKRKDLDIGTLTVIPPRIHTMLLRKKVLIVLDDVNSSPILEALVGWLGSESRILVTSTNLEALNNCDETYEVQKLDENDALRLFMFYAFREDSPTEEHKQLFKDVLRRTKRIPFLLRHLGSHLYRKGIEVWNSKLADLEDNLDKNYEKVLLMNFNDLDLAEQSVLLDIACFFRRCNKNFASNFYSKDAISCLKDRCFINISNEDIRMHVFLQQLGQEIVLKEARNDPGKCRRLWIAEDIYHILKHDREIEEAEAISLDMSKIQAVCLGPKAFEKIQYKLRLLKFYYPRRPHVDFAFHTATVVAEEMKIRLQDGLQFLLNQLRILRWDGYPVKSLPSNFDPKELVELRMRCSNLEVLWENFPLLVKLKILDLSYSSNLIEVPDLNKVPNLEVLDLSFCERLEEVPRSIRRCQKLKEVNFSNCKKLWKLPEIPGSFHLLTSLQALSFSGCSKLTGLTEIPLNVLKLSLCDTALEQVPSSIGDLSELVKLDLRGCKSLKSLPNNIGQLRFLVELNLRGCSRLTDLPETNYDWHFLQFLDLEGCSLSSLREILNSLCPLVSLRKLNLTGNHFSDIPPSIRQLSKLTDLILRGCWKLRCLPELPSSVQCLIVECCINLESVDGINTNVQDEYEAAFQIFNFAHCTKLNPQDACKKIMDDAKLRIQHIATLLFNQEHRYAYDIVVPIGARFCVPGSEVPAWFRHTRGSSLEISRPSHSKQFSGCAFCAVVRYNHNTHADDEDYGSYDEECIDDWVKLRDIRCEWNLITETGCRDLRSSYVFHDVNTEKIISSDHVFVWYDPSFTSSNFTEATFKFYLDYEPGTDMFPYEVIKCGIHLLSTPNDEQPPYCPRDRPTDRDQPSSSSVC